MATKQDVVACFALLMFRADQFKEALTAEVVNRPYAMPEMALFDVEEAVQNLRECFDEVANATR